MGACAVRFFHFIFIALAFSGCAPGKNIFFRQDPLINARADFKAGQYDKVLTRLPTTKISDLPRRYRPQAYDLVGSSLIQKKELAKALQTYQLAVGLYPKNLILLTKLADILNGAQLPQRARPHYEKILSIHPNNAGAHLGIAHIYRKQGYLIKALTHFEKALAAWGDNPFIWKIYGETLAEAGHLEEAITAMDTSLTYRQDPETIRSRARFERLRGNLESAYTELDKAIKDSPEQIEFKLELGLWLLKDNRLQEAFQIAEDILVEDPGNPLARWLRASIFLRRGKIQSAQVDLAVCAEAKSSHPFIAKTATVMLKEISGGSQ